MSLSLRVAWYKVGDSTRWAVFSGRLGEAGSQPGDYRSNDGLPSC